MLATQTHHHQAQRPFGAPPLHPHLHHPHFPSYPPPQLFLPPVPLPPVSSFFTPSWRSASHPASSHKRRLEETEDCDGAEQEGSPPKRLAVELVLPERVSETTAVELRAEDMAVMPEVEMGSRRNEGGGGFEMGEMCW